METITLRTDPKNEQQNPMEGKKVIFVNDDMDPENADGVKGHLEAFGDSDFALSEPAFPWRKAKASSKAAPGR